MAICGVDEPATSEPGALAAVGIIVRVVESTNQSMTTLHLHSRLVDRTQHVHKITTKLRPHLPTRYTLYRPAGPASAVRVRLRKGVTTFGKLLTGPDSCGVLGVFTVYIRCEYQALR